MYHMQTQQKTVLCHQCKKAFKTELDCKTHGVAKQHQYQTPVTVSSTDRVKTASVAVANAETLQSPSASKICKVCNRVFDSREEWGKHYVNDHWYTTREEAEHARVPAVLNPLVACLPYSNGEAYVEATVAWESGGTCAIQDSLECVALDESCPGVSGLSQSKMLSWDQSDGTAAANADLHQGKEQVRAQRNGYTVEQDGITTNISSALWLEDFKEQVDAVETVVILDADETLDTECPTLFHPITQTTATAESIGIPGVHADVASDAGFGQIRAIGVHDLAQLKQEMQVLKEAQVGLLCRADRIAMKITVLEGSLRSPLQTWDEDGSTGKDAKLEAQAMSINRTARVSSDSTEPISDEPISDILMHRYLAAQFEYLHHMHPNALSTTSAVASGCATRATSPAISIFDDLAEWEEALCEEADSDSSDSHIVQPPAQLLPSEISDYVTIPHVEDA